MRWDLGHALLGAQLGCIVAVVWHYGPPELALPVWARVLSWALVAIGLLIGLWGARGLGRSLRAHPAPSEHAMLRIDGAYALTRHPIYTGVIAGLLGLALLRGRAEPLIAWAALTGVLYLKSVYEERLLVARFGEAYSVYRQRVPRLLPRPRRRR